MTPSDGTWELYVACSGSMGSASWAYRLVCDRALIAEGSGSGEATPPRAELLAMVRGLGELPESAWSVRILTTNENHCRYLPDHVAGRQRFGKRPRHHDLVVELRDLLHGRPALWEAPITTHADFKAVRAAARRGASASAPAETTDPRVVRAVAPAEGGRPRVAGTSSTVLAYTDGGCRGNPGPGGWGFVLVHVPSGVTLESRGGDAATTNNRMEMLAAIRCLEALTRPGQDVEIRTDSSYLRDLATKWRLAWKRKGWRKADGEPVANLDLVQALDLLLAQHRVTWTKVKGHAGEPGNERADQLTNEAMDAVQANRDPAWTARHPIGPFDVGGG